MKKGKLYQQIEDNSETAMYRYAWRKTIDLKTLHKILDEMWSEFALDDIPNHTPREEFVNRLVKLNRERLNWRLKWLGGDE